MTPLTVRSVQWPHSGDARLSEALRLTRYAAPGACAVIAGDFNSLYPDCQTYVAEFGPGQGGRIDHILLSPMLARAVVPGSYQVHVSDAGSKASDHRLVSVRRDLTHVRFSLPRAGR